MPSNACPGKPDPHVGALSRKGILLLTSLLLLAWPCVIWLGLAHNSLRWLLPLMALLLYLRLRQTRRQAGPLRIVTQVVALAGIVLCVASTLLKTHQLLLFYPVVVNVVMLAAFGGSLWTTMPLVERLARIQEPHLPAAAVRYTRRVTQIWCLFLSSMAVSPSLRRCTVIWRSGPHGTA